MENKSTIISRDRLKKAVIGCTALLILLHMALGLMMSGSKLNESPENRLLLYGESLLTAVVLGGIAYGLMKAWKDPQTHQPAGQRLRRLLCPEAAVLLFLLADYALVCLVNAIQFPGSFSYGHAFLVDMIISVLLLFPMALVMGLHKARRLMHRVLDVVMLGGTGFVLWALWHLFSATSVKMPGGQFLGMAGNYAFWMGSNPNNSAAICTAMLMICLYRMANGKKAEKIVYSVAFVPHLLMILYTNSRGNFLALWIVLPLAAAWALWPLLASRKRMIRLAVCFSCVVCTAVLLYFLRTWVFDFYRAVVQQLPVRQSTAAAAEGVVRSDLSLDVSRQRIWHASVSHMLSSPRAFFLGTPIYEIPRAIKEATVSLYGSGQEFAQAHNIILHVGLVMGVPGMAAFVAFCGLLFCRCVRVLFGKGSKAQPGAFILPLCIGGMVVINMAEALLLFFRTLMGSLFFLYAGWVTAMDRGID